MVVSKTIVSYMLVTIVCFDFDDLEHNFRTPPLIIDGFYRYFTAFTEMMYIFIEMSRTLYRKR